MQFDAETIAAIAISVFSLVGSVLGIVHTYRSKGRFDLEKTIGAAGDVVEVVKALRKAGKKPDEAAEMGVDMVEGIRGKKLNDKLRRKARAHIIDKAEFPLGETVDGIAALTRAALASKGDKDEEAP